MKPTRVDGFPQFVVDDWRDFADAKLDLPLQAARDLFAEHGYHGTSIRAIAGRAGLSVPGLYHYYQSKQAILDTLISRVMAQMLAHTHAADRASDGTPTGRFNNVVEALLRFHMFCRKEAFVASTEMRSMEEDVLRRHIASRDEQQNMIKEILTEGVTEGTFRCEYVKEGARAVASLCVSVSSWYRPDGSLSPEELVQRYLTIIRHLVGAGATETIPEQDVRTCRQIL